MRQFRGRTLRVLADDAAPEGDATLITRGDADYPLARKAVPEQKGRVSTNTRAAQLPDHEEFGDVHHIWVRRSRRASRRQREARQSPITTNKKREAAFRLGPVQGQPRVLETSIGAECDLGEDLAEVVDVELE